jgi:hypothetical protein
MKEQCPKGCGPDAMKHMKSCDGAPTKALTGRNGMMKMGDISGEKGFGM